MAAARGVVRTDRWSYPVVGRLMSGWYRVVVRASDGGGLAMSSARGCRSVGNGGVEMVVVRDSVEEWRVMGF